MVVYIVTNTSNGAGYIEGVFSTSSRASAYMAIHPYSSFLITECEVDKHITDANVAADARKKVPQSAGTADAKT